MYKEISLFARDFINIPSFRTSPRKKQIREAYKELTGEELKRSCSTCYVEALLKILNLIKMATPNYELKRGVVLEAFGDASKTCTNDTLTDELGDWYMRNQPDKKIYFSKYPEKPINPVPEVISEKKVVNEIPDPMKVAAELNAKQQAIKDLDDSINEKTVDVITDPPVPEETKKKVGKVPKKSK